MTQQKTRWSSPRDLEYADQGVVRDSDKVLPQKSRVIRGGHYHVEDDFGARLPETASISKAITLGKIQLLSTARSGVRVEYIPSQYGIGKVESLEERELRYQSEIASLKLDADQREEAAYLRGQQEGHEKGLNEGRQEVAQHIAEIIDFLETIRKETRGYFQQVEKRLVEFAMMIARKVVGDSAESHREVAVKLAREAIQQAIERTQVILLVNSSDAEHLKGARADLLALGEGIKDIDIQISQRVSPGSVILESAGGSIDATIETILDELHMALLPETANEQRIKREGGSG